MAKYRIVKTVRWSSKPDFVWVDKPTDAAAVAAAAALLRRGESAEVWSETSCVKCIQLGSVRGATGPTVSNVTAAVLMTMGIALTCVALHDGWIGSTARPAQFVVASPALEEVAKTPIQESWLVPNREEANRSGETTKRSDPASLGEIKKPARRSQIAKPQLAAKAGTTSSLFAARSQPQINVYSLMGAGSIEGGN